MEPGKAGVKQRLPDRQPGQGGVVLEVHPRPESPQLKICAGRSACEMPVLEEPVGEVANVKALALRPGLESQVDLSIHAESPSGEIGRADRKVPIVDDGDLGV